MPNSCEPRPVQTLRRQPLHAPCSPQTIRFEQDILEKLFTLSHLLGSLPVCVENGEPGSYCTPESFHTRSACTKLRPTSVRQGARRGQANQRQCFERRRGRSIAGPSRMALLPNVCKAHWIMFYVRDPALNVIFCTAPPPLSLWQRNLVFSFTSSLSESKCSSLSLRHLSDFGQKSNATHGLLSTHLVLSH